MSAKRERLMKSAARLCQGADDELWLANFAALSLRGGHKSAGPMIAMSGPSSRFVRLVADALVAPLAVRCDQRVIGAYIEAWHVAARTPTGLDISAEPPTMNEVKKQFEALFPDQTTPRESSMRRTLNTLKLPYRRLRKTTPRN